MHGVASAHGVQVLGKEAALGVLEVPQVDLDQQVHVAIVYYLGHGVVVPVLLLSLLGLSVHHVCLEFQILASSMTEGLGLLRQGKPIDEGVSSQLLLVQQLDLQGLDQLPDESAVRVQAGLGVLGGDQGIGLEQAIPGSSELP